jgi:hypothetical protein
MIRQTELRPGSYAKSGAASTARPKAGLTGNQSDALRQAALAAMRKSGIRSTVRPATPVRPSPGRNQNSHTVLPASALAELAADRARQRRLRLSAAVIAIAVLILLRVIWVHVPKQSVRSLQALQTGAKHGTGNRAPRGSSFATALNRLNEDLTFTQGMSPEELLKQVRASRQPETPPVCNFSWNYGQPALLYHAGIPMDRELNHCAEAVERFVFGKVGQKKAPAENGQGF